MQLGVREVAKILGVSEKSVYRWIQSGSLPAYRVQDQYRIHRAELLEWVTTKKIPVSEEIFAEPHGEDHPGLADALETGGIHYRVEGGDKETVLRNAVKTMRLPEGADPEFLFRVLLARESLCSTGIGEGVAIPHPRSPVVLHVSQPSITLCFLENEVEFDAMDGQPVKVLFTLISPTVRGHLHLLSRLTYALRDPEFKEAINTQAGREQILSAARKLDGGAEKK